MTATIPSPDLSRADVALETFDPGDGLLRAFRRTPAQGGRASLMWLGGFKSDMEGGKAVHLHAWAAESGRGYTRFDYHGHGSSGGRFEDGTISLWRDDALAVLDRATEGPQVLVGSSMGGWMALLAALARPERVAGLILIAPAPDFTQALMWEGFSEEIRRDIMETGAWMAPSEYDPGGYPITRALIEDGRRHLLLDKGPIAITAPVRILQGARDADVPWTHAQRLVDALASEDLEFTLVKSGDHRLSEPHDLDRLTRTAQALCAQVEAKMAASPSR